MLSSSCSSRPRGARRRRLRLGGVWGRGPGPPSGVEMHKVEIALGTSSLAVWTGLLMAVCIQGVCGPRGPRVTGERGGREPFLHKRLPTCPLFCPGICNWGAGWAHLPARARDPARPHARAHCQASAGQSCLQLCLGLSPALPPRLPTRSFPPRAPTQPPQRGDLQRPRPILGLAWACGARGTTLAAFLPKAQEAACGETSWSSEAEVRPEPEILTFRKWPESAAQRPNQGFSALPLSGGVGCPARLPGPEDSWSGAASSWVSRAGSNFQKQRTTQAE